jgi:hypothetical protein
MKNEGIGYCHRKRAFDFEEMLEQKQASPSSRFGSSYHEFDTRDMHITTTYTLFLNVRGVPTKMLVECRSLNMMECGQ